MRIFMATKGSVLEQQHPKAHHQGYPEQSQGSWSQTIRKKTSTRPLAQKCLLGEQPVKSHLA